MCVGMYILEQFSGREIGEKSRLNYLWGYYSKDGRGLSCRITEELEFTKFVWVW